jgi:phosphoenolpyruvate carboxykinase (GTP)
VPAPGAIDTRDLSVSEQDMAELLRVDDAGWRLELPGMQQHFARFGGRLPQQLRDQLSSLEDRLGE